MTPGNSKTSASHLPSFSFSVSIVNLRLGMLISLPYFVSFFHILVTVRIPHSSSANSCPTYAVCKDRNCGVSFGDACAYALLTLRGAIPDKQRGGWSALLCLAFAPSLNVKGVGVRAESTYLNLCR